MKIKIKAKVCPFCSKIVKILDYKLINEIVYFQKIIDTKFFDSLNKNSQNFLIKLNSKTFSHFRNLRKEFGINYLNIIKDLWTHGFIKIKRNKINPKLTSSIELSSKYHEKFINNLEKKGMINKTISLTPNCKNFFINRFIHLKNKEIKEKRSQIISKIKSKIKYLEGLVHKNPDERIKWIKQIFENIQFKSNVTIGIQRCDLDFLNKFDILEYNLDFLIYVCNEISKKELISIKNFNKIYKKKISKEKFEKLKKSIRDFRNIPRIILKFDLTCYNIVKEPMKNISRSMRLFRELQNFLINFLEPLINSFVINNLKSEVDLDKIWSERIPRNVRNSIKGAFYSTKKKLKVERIIYEAEFQDLIDNCKIDELLNYSLFNSLGSIIIYPVNWDSIFKDYFTFCSTSSELQDKFLKLFFLRNKVAHKKDIKIDILKILKIENIELSEILEFCFNLLRSL